MFSYKTAQEIAKKWGVTVRYVQLLCKNDKIDGAMKKAGSWFIPEDAQNPEEKKKSSGVFESPTKNAIFDKSIELFSLYRFEVVTIKDIAHDIGRNQASIYNHFESKQDILDNIYDYFSKQFLLDRPTINDLEPVLINGNLYDIIDTVFYTFQSEHVDRLISITKIIHTRQFTDERAKQIALEIMVQSGIDFAKAVFDRAVEIQRIKPCDTHTLSLFCNYVRQGIYNRLILDPREENYIQLQKEEEILKKCAASMLTDLHEETKT